MSQWLSLTKKEIRLGLPALLTPIIVFIIVSSIAYYIGYKNDVGTYAVMIVALVATLAQIFYLPYYLLYSLSAERKKLHLWLHNPLPAAALIGAKMVAGLLSMIVTLFITGTTGLMTLTLKSELLDRIGISLSSLYKPLMFGGIHLFLFSISLAVAFIFFWMIFLMLTRSIGTFVSFISTFAIVIACGSLYSFISETRFYETVSKWGAFEVPGFLRGLEYTINGSLVNGEIITDVGNVSFYAGSYLIETLLALILFFAACWILNRKVEV